MDRIRELEMAISKLATRDKQLQLDFKAHKDKLERLNASKEPS